MDKIHFVVLHTGSGGGLIFRVEHISVIVDSFGDGSHVYVIGSDDPFTVKETKEEIIEIIRGSYSESL